MRSPFASYGVAGSRTMIPPMCEYIASGLSEWCSRVLTPPLTGVRMVIGSLKVDLVLDLYLAAWLTIWLNPTYMKPANCISGIGCIPDSAIPIEVPIMADSASGVSMTLSSPNFSTSPSVTLKTPPSTPMSSPSRTALCSPSV